MSLKSCFFNIFFCFNFQSHDNYDDLENSMIRERDNDTLEFGSENPENCHHVWSVYKKKFRICRKCQTKRDANLNELSK